MARLFAALMGLAGALGIAPATSAEAQTQASVTSSPPTAWVAYAELTNTAITDRLKSEDERAQRIRTYLLEMKTTAQQPLPPLVLKIWVDAEGAVSKVEFAPFAHEQANADLKDLLEETQLSKVPPRDMRLPMRMALDVEAQ